MFQLCGGTGLALAVFFAMIQVRSVGLSRGVMAGIVVGTVLTSLVLAMVTKIIMGEEWLVYYHHHLAAMIVIPVALSLLHQPIRPYLDLIFLGGGVFVVCGRIGCLMVGCCHGRPHSWGVCYRPEHAAVGFPSYYVAVRLLPVQLMESLSVFFIVTVGGFLILSNHRPGDAFVWYVVAYGLARFCLEFLRGDSGRHHVFGFSESQWISFGLLCFVVWAEYAGLLIHHSWHLAGAVLMAVTMVGIFLTRRRRTSIRYGLRNPEHMILVAEALERLSHATTHSTRSPWQPVTAADIPIECATFGIRISSSRIQSPEGPAYLYGLSFHDDTMTQQDAWTIAELVVQLKHPGASNELIKGNRGVFHLLVRPVNGVPSSHSAEIQQRWLKQWALPVRGH